MKNINMFDAQREFAERVSKFVDLKVLRAQYGEEYRVQVKSTQDLIKAQKSLEGSFLADKIEERVAKYNADLELFKQAYEEKLAKMDAFDLADDEKKLKKALRPLGCDDTKAIKDALREFFKGHGLNITGTDFEQSLMNALGGRVDMKKFVKSEGTDGISLASGQAMNIIFWVTFNYMASAGTIKPAMIPEILKAKYIKDNKVVKAVADAQK